MKGEIMGLLVAWLEIGIVVLATVVSISCLMSKYADKVEKSTNMDVKLYFASILWGELYVGALLLLIISVVFVGASEADHGIAAFTIFGLVWLFYFIGLNIEGFTTMKSMTREG